MMQKQSIIFFVFFLSAIHIIDGRPRKDKKINFELFKNRYDLKSIDKLRSEKGFGQFCPHSSSSSSSSSDCSDDSDHHVCKPECDRVIPITHVPCTITRSGKYCLARDVEFSGPGAAITISADNVFLNFATHSITLESLSTAILIVDSTEISISNDGLIYAAKTKGPAAVGIHILNSEKVDLDNTAFFFFGAGVLVDNSVDITIKNSRFNSNIQGILTSESQALLIQDCTFSNCDEGLHFDNASKDILVNKVVETNSQFGSYIRWADGVTIEHSIFQSLVVTDPFSLLQIGSTSEEEGVVHDLIIRNCQFINRTPITSSDPGAGFDGILFAAGSNALLENCVVDINAAPFLGNPQQGFLQYINGALHFGQTLPTTTAPFPATPTRIFFNVRVRNCVLSNLGGNAITTENSTNNITFENNIINSAAVGVYLQGTTTTVIKYNEIQNNGGGGVALASSSLILPEVGSSSNTVEYNVISNNGFSGVELTPTSANNLVKYNQVFGNGLRGINNNGVDNRIFYNIAFNNGAGPADNFVGVAVVNTPGNPTLSGENISA